MTTTTSSACALMVNKEDQQNCTPSKIGTDVLKINPQIFLGKFFVSLTLFSPLS